MKEMKEMKETNPHSGHPLPRNILTSTVLVLHIVRNMCIPDYLSPNFQKAVRKRALLIPRNYCLLDRVIGDPASCCSCAFNSCHPFLFPSSPFFTFFLHFLSSLFSLCFLLHFDSFPFFSFYRSSGANHSGHRLSMTHLYEKMANQTP